MSHDRARALLDQQLAEGVLPAEEDRELRAHLEGCDECRRIYDRHVEVERTLEGRSAPRAQIERLLARGAPIDVALAPPGGATIHEIPRPDRRQSDGPAHRSRLVAHAVPLVALAASLLVALAISLRTRVPGDDEMRARGVETKPLGRTAWVNVFHRAGGRGDALPLGAKIRAGDTLLFAYTSLTSGGHDYLAVAARDATGKVRWYFPAWRDAAEDPTSLAIRRGTNVELPEELVVDASPGALEICALFTDTPLRVRDVDGALEKEHRWPEGAAKDCRTVEVAP